MADQGLFHCTLRFEDLVPQVRATCPAPRAPPRSRPAPRRTPRTSSVLSRFSRSRTSTASSRTSSLASSSPSPGALSSSKRPALCPFVVTINPLSLAPRASTFNTRVHSRVSAHTSHSKCKSPTRLHIHTETKTEGGYSGRSWGLGGALVRRHVSVARVTEDCSLNAPRSGVCWAGSRAHE